MPIARFSFIGSFQFECLSVPCGQVPLGKRDETLLATLPKPNFAYKTKLDFTIYSLIIDHSLDEFLVAEEAA